MNNNLQIDEDVILERFEIINVSLTKLGGLKDLSPGRFMLGENFAIAEHYLRYALEATFDICSHILSRITGAKLDEYKQMALEMGKQEIIPMDFAEKTLYKMGGYRNRLTHFYFEVTPKEMYNIVQHKLGDFKKFMGFIKKLIQKQNGNNKK